METWGNTAILLDPRSEEKNDGAGNEAKALAALLELASKSLRETHWGKMAKPHAI